MSFTDKSLACLDCGESFTFTASEQEFYETKGFTNEPKRCPSCRQAKKSQRNGNSSYGSRRQMFPVTCAQCGIDTEVPFKPTDGRPVYCRDCFSKTTTRSY